MDWMRISVWKHGKVPLTRGAESSNPIITGPAGPGRGIGKHTDTVGMRSLAWCVLFCVLVVVCAGNDDLYAAMRAQAVTLAQGAIPGLQPGAVIWEFH